MMRKKYVAKVEMVYTSALPFGLPSITGSSEAFSNPEARPVKTGDIDMKQERREKQQSKNSCFNIGVDSEISKFVAGEKQSDTTEHILKDKTKRNLETQISMVREEMIAIALTKGFNNPKTVELSQKLDSLLNEYNQIK